MTTRRWQWVALAALAGVLLWGFAVGTDVSDPATAVAERISCPVCDGESVAASQSELARSMAVQIDELIDAGYTQREAIAWFEERYGPEIVLDPPLDLGGALLWAVPVLVAVGGAFVIVRLRRESTSSEAEPRSARSLATLGVLAVVLVGTVFALGQFLEPRAEGTPVSGDIVAPTDLESISDEALALTIAGFEDDPDISPQQLNGMRLALAERYFEAGDYRSATEVFRTVLEDEPTPSQASETLGRLGWILYANDELGPAEVAFTQAIETFDGNGEARYFFSLMLLETDRGAEAVPHLEALMEDPSVPDDLRPEIEAMLEAARA